MKDDGPIGYYTYSTSDKTLTFLFNHRDVLTKYQLAKMEGIVIKARDGLEMPSYLTKPVGASGPVPLVVLVHGGPWARDDWGFDAEAQWLANRGYAVLQVNYRGSTGFGKSFTSKGNLEWGRKMHEDLLDAVQWAVKEKVADPSKVAICGGSYGGYAALWGATQSGDVFKCAVDIVGPSNLVTLLSSFPAYWASFMEIAYRQVGDLRTEEGRALLKERSPLTHVNNIKIPVLIAQGEKDPRVKQVESEQIVAAMKEKGLPYIYMLFLDEGHGFARPENKFAFYGAAEHFFADHLGGRFEKMTTELDKTTLDPAQKEDLKQRFAK
jgi:dipeptidyl aminopeptidase/acylaminoacyl peptidase